ncbi:DUF5819 family protein [Leucobacter allii]
MRHDAAVRDDGRAPDDEAVAGGEAVVDAEPTAHGEASATGAAMPAEGGAAPAAASPRPWVRIVAGAAVLLTAWQVFASFLWIAPPSPLREVVPGNALSSYMLPFFGQSWSVFAPEPINGDYHFNVRAVVEEDGAEVETGWVSATDVELSMIRYNLFPPRAGIQSSDLASAYKSAYDALGREQQEIVASAHTQDGWEDALRQELLVGGTGDDDADLTGDRAGAEEVDAYLEADHRSTAYATQVARAIWGDEVRSVQFRVSRQNIVPFAERNTPGAARPDPQLTETGPRGQLVEAGQNDENFARTFRAQYERITG